MKRLLEDPAAQAEIEIPAEPDQEHDPGAEEVKENEPEFQNPVIDPEIDAQEPDWAQYDEKEDKYGMSYNELICPLIKSVQELTAENNQLKSQLANVMSRLDALENK